MVAPRGTTAAEAAAAAAASPLPVIADDGDEHDDGGGGEGGGGGGEVVYQPAPFNAEPAELDADEDGCAARTTGAGGRTGASRCTLSRTRRSERSDCQHSI